MNVSRSVKRLMLIIVLSVIVILLSKSLLGKAVKNLSIAAEKKQHITSSKLATLTASAPALAVPTALEISSSDVSAGSAVTEVESSVVAADRISAGH